MCRCGNMIIRNPANLICGVFFDLIGINKLVFKKDKIISVACGRGMQFRANGCGNLK